MQPPLPEAMSPADKDVLRQAFFDFCTQHNVSGWAVLLQVTAPGQLPEPPPAGVPTYGISYLSAMHIQQDLPRGADRQIIGAAAGTMARQGEFFQTAVARADAAYGTATTVLLHVPDGTPAANGD